MPGMWGCVRSRACPVEMVEMQGLGLGGDGRQGRSGGAEIREVKRAGQSVIHAPLVPVCALSWLGNRSLRLRRQSRMLSPSGDPLTLWPFPARREDLETLFPDQAEIEDSPEGMEKKQW